MLRSGASLLHKRKTHHDSLTPLNAHQDQGKRKSGGGPADAGSFNSESGVRGPLLVWYSNAPVQSRYPAPAGSAYVLWLSRRPDCHFDCLNQPLRTYHRLRILGSDHPRERQALLPPSRGNFAYDLRTTCLRVCSVMAARSMPLYLSRQQRVESGHDHVPIPSWPERSKLSTWRIALTIPVEAAHEEIRPRCFGLLRRRRRASDAARVCRIVHCRD